MGILSGLFGGGNSGGSAPVSAPPVQASAHPLLKPSAGAFNNLPSTQNPYQSAHPLLRPSPGVFNKFGANLSPAPQQNFQGVRPTMPQPMPAGLQLPTAPLNTQMGAPMDPTQMQQMQMMQTFKQVQTDLGNTQQQFIKQLPKEIQGNLGTPAKGLNSKYGEMFEKIGNQYGIDPMLLNNVAKVESRFNPNAKSPMSSAGGMFQFIDGTWRAYAPKVAADGYAPNKFDPESSTAAAALYMKDNQTALQNKLGKPVSGYELYVAHNLGLGGAAKLLSADPQSKVSSILSPQVMKNNPLFFKGNPTVQESLDRYKNYIGL